MNRRDFGAAALGAMMLPASRRARGADEVRVKAPFRVLYSNDTTNILSCASPWHKKGEKFRREMLEATVDEVAESGVDAHFLQPGMGWVPWWRSKIYPMETHAAWLADRYGIKLDSFAQFVLDGGDMAQIFIDRCRLRGQAPFISLRMNDGHHKEWVDAKKGDKIPTSASQTLTPFYADHPEYRIGADLKDWGQRVQNWAIPEVRAHKFAFLQELCENYDLDGLELDFMRHHSLFRQEETTREQRVRIIGDFVRDVRALLDRTQRGGRRRWLCARAPWHPVMRDRLGIDAGVLAASGLDMLNASANYFTTQSHDLGSLRRAAPDIALYFEMCHSIWNGPKLTEGYDAFAFRRATPEQYQTTAHLAYARGADGVSFFNFAYYREHGGAGRGPFNEPPFDVIKGLRDPQWLARQPQHWFIASGWRPPDTKPNQVPRKVEAGRFYPFHFDLASPTGGWTKGGRLRIQAAASLADGKWSAKFNGTELAGLDDVSEPYPNPYSPLLGKPEEMRAWRVPTELLAPGINRLEIRMDAGETANLAYVDLAIS